MPINVSKTCFCPVSGIAVWIFTYGFKNFVHVHTPLTSQKNSFSPINLRWSPYRHQRCSHTGIDPLCPGSIGAFPLKMYVNAAISFSCRSKQLLSQVSRLLNCLRTLELFVLQWEDDRQWNRKPHLLPVRIAGQYGPHCQIALWTDSYMNSLFEDYHLMQLF